ncbi:MAG: ATP-grasp domain-containing protein [Clostridia bacterium]|nr:ATP-grasp domain-containing protein [Clostridia bacterium]
MRKKLAIIGASYLQLPLIERAKELGFSTHVFAWAADDVGEKAADHFYPISITEKEMIAEKCREIGICGVCSIATDLGAITVNYVANELGLPGNSMDCAVKSTNKHLMRRVFEENGDPSPRSIQVDEETDLSSLRLSYPVIVKPTDRSGSRGIFKLDGPEGLREAIRGSIGQSFEKKALIEEFAEGQEYSVEGISFRGEHHILAVTLKYTTGAPHFIETGHLEPAPVSAELRRKVEMVVMHALSSLGIENSASHSELKIDKDGNIKIIEIGGRMGGDCIGSDLVQYSTGIDYIRAVIQVACGEEPDLAPMHGPIPAEVRFIFNEQDVAEMKRLQKTDRFIKLINFHPEYLGKATNSSDRAGCYLIKV